MEWFIKTCFRSSEYVRDSGFASKLYKESQWDPKQELLRAWAVKHGSIKGESCLLEAVTGQWVCEDRADQKDLECAVVISRLGIMISGVVISNE
jgi:hypothetical protein